MRTLSVSEFKARCLSILDEVAETGEPVLVTKRGRAVAQIAPATIPGEGFPQASLFGTVEVLGDIVAPALEPESWHAVSEDLP